MKLQLFSVWDAAAERFLQPFPASTIEVAIREFRQAVQTAGHQFNTFSADYTLFHLGEFNQENGAVVGNATPHNLGLAISFMPPGDIGTSEQELEVERRYKAVKDA